MPSDLRSRLQRLRPARHKAVPPSVPIAEVVQRRAEHVTRAQDLLEASSLPGAVQGNPAGEFQIIEARYPLEHRHGEHTLREAFDQPAAAAARLARDDALGQADLRSLAFIDTETTGLAGGAGTLAFLIGVGVCENESFVVRQYFMRDPAEELAVLTQIVQDLEGKAGWVSFNGKAFDLPLLETRLTLNRLRGALGRRPHLDLLTPARRLYRGRLDSCSLGTLEQAVVHVLRDQEDVAGALIPDMYLAYLRTRDAREMRRVIYHNAVDILSMVALMAHLLEVFTSSVAEPRSAPLQAADWLRLGTWHEDHGRFPDADTAYRQALGGTLTLEERSLGLRRLAGLLKKQERRGEAVPLWEQWASFSLDDPEPFVELAKYYEWHGGDLELALQWAERARRILHSLPRPALQREALAEVAHRCDRLRAKQSRHAG